MNKLFALFLLSIICFTSCDVANIMLGEPNENEINYAISKLLDSSALKAINHLKAVNQEGIGGVLPEELQPVLSTLRATGAIKDLDKVENTLQKVSNTVIEESDYLMKDAIRQVNFQDGVAIILGGKDAATQVLREKMYISVKNRYSDKIENELKQVDPNIEQYWPAAASAYNLLAKNKVDSNLPDFIAERSVDLLFNSMGAAESDYRDNISALGDGLVTKVFDYYRNQGPQGSQRKLSPTYNQ